MRRSPTNMPRFAGLTVACSLLGVVRAITAEISDKYYLTILQDGYLKGILLREKKLMIGSGSGWAEHPHRSRQEATTYR